MTWAIRRLAGEGLHELGPDGQRGLGVHVRDPVQVPPRGLLFGGGAPSARGCDRTPAGRSSVEVSSHDRSTDRCVCVPVSFPSFPIYFGLIFGSD